MARMTTAGRRKFLEDLKANQGKVPVDPKYPVFDASEWLPGHEWPVRVWFDDDLGGSAAWKGNAWAFTRPDEAEGKTVIRWQELPPQHTAGRPTVSHHAPPVQNPCRPPNSISNL